jgi:ADP-ribose pyrophosphatase YjhB (NUDIX family)
MDCSFTQDNKRFRYRAAGIIIHDGKVLFAKNDKDDYYYSVGGAVKFGETVEEAVLREVFEETGVHYDIDRLLFFHENFFTGVGGTLDGIEYHEISFYYLMKPKDITKFNCTSTTTNGAKEELHWLPIDELDKYKAFPEFLKDKLKDFNLDVQHVITRS